MGSGSRHASFVCLLLLAMKGGKRRCSVDARGLLWTKSQLRFLEISLKQIHPDDVSRLRINVREDARCSVGVAADVYTFRVFKCLVRNKQRHRTYTMTSASHTKNPFFRALAADIVADTDLRDSVEEEGGVMPETALSRSFPLWKMGRYVS